MSTTPRIRVCLLISVALCFVLTSCGLSADSIARQTAEAGTALAATWTATISPTPTKTNTPRPTNTPQPTATTPPTVTPIPTELPLPADVELVFGDGVPQNERDLVRYGVALAANDLGTSGALTVYAYDNLDLLLSAYSQYQNQPTNDATRNRWQTGLGESNLGVIFLYTASTGWLEASEALRLRTVVHEYYHTVQAYLVGQRISTGDERVPQVGPVWLIEGSADFMAVRVLANHGLYDAVADHQQRIDRGRQFPATLNSIESWGAARAIDINSPYSLGFLAVEFLVSRSGDEALAQYWKALQNGASWKTVFALAFGLPIEKFYQDFSAYQLQLYPLRISGKVTDPGGVLLGGIFVTACPAGEECISQVLGGTAVHAWTATDGTYQLLLVTDGSYVVHFGFTADSVAGYYSANGLTTDPLQASAISVTNVPVEGINVQLKVERATSAEVRYISGLVTDSSGAPFTGIEAFACPLPAGERGCIFSRIGGDGRYAIAVPDNTRYVVNFGSPFGLSYCYTPSGVNISGTSAMWDGVTCAQIEVSGSNVGGINGQLPMLNSQFPPTSTP